MTILQFFKNTVLTLALIFYFFKVINQIWKKNYKSWDERYVENEIYTFLDLCVIDRKNLNKIELFSIVAISITIKTITKIQYYITILIIPLVYFNLLELKHSDKICKKLFINIPTAYAEIICLSWKNKKIQKIDIEAIKINITFSFIYRRSRWNITESKKCLKQLYSIRKDPRFKKEKLKTGKTHWMIFFKENFNETINVALKLKTRS